MKCRLEWDPQAGLMLTVIPMPELPILPRDGGVAGEAGDAAEAACRAGGGSDYTAILGGKSQKRIEELKKQEVKNA